MRNLEQDLRHTKLLITKSLECAESTTGGVRDTMLNQALRLEKQAAAIQAQIDALAPASPKAKDPSIPTLNITVEMGNKRKSPKKSAPQTRSKKISKRVTKKKAPAKSRRKA